LQLLVDSCACSKLIILCSMQHAWASGGEGAHLTCLFGTPHEQAARQQALVQLGLEVSDLLGELEENYYSTPPETTSAAAS